MYESSSLAAEDREFPLAASGSFAATQTRRPRAPKTNVTSLIAASNIRENGTICVEDTVLDMSLMRSTGESTRGAAKPPAQPHHHKRGEYVPTKARGHFNADSPQEKLNEAVMVLNKSLQV